MLRAIMRILTVAALAGLLASPAMPPAWAATVPKFQSTDDYVRLCMTSRPGADCKEAFVEANNWVQFNSDVKICAPDLKTSFGSREYDAAVAGEINGAIGWMKQHPDMVTLDYVQSLGQSLIALYPCP